MASRRDAALEFIKRRFAERGRGPSVGELGMALGTNKERAAAILRRLAKDGSIIRVPGAPGKRGEIRLPDTADQISLGDALRVLRREAERLDVATFREMLGPLALPVTETHLFMPVELDYLPDVESGGTPDDGAGAAGDGR